MKILVIGSKGNMGRRYTAILKYLGHEVIGLDLDNFQAIFHYEKNDITCPNSYEASLKTTINRAIIATPIDKHYEWCVWCINNKIPFLCEKPISKDIDEIKNLMAFSENAGVDGRMVCNWAFIHSYETLLPGENGITLDYYNTGNDGFWDLIQPVYLGKKFTLRKKSPAYICTTNGHIVNQYNFDWSYVNMIKKWLENSKEIWSLPQALEATKKLIAWAKDNYHE
jgi:hypothetical protein